jgi:hypothetical protein
MAYHHVFALHDAKEKWQGAPLLESGRKQPSRWWPGGPAAGALVLYLGEINDSQREVWRKSIEVFEDGRSAPRTVALFAEEKTAPIDDAQVILLWLILVSRKLQIDLWGPSVSAEEKK